MQTPVHTSAENHRIDIVRLQPTDGEPLLAMLRRCSPATLYRRFHGVTDGASFARQQLGADALRDAYAAWSADSCVGLAAMQVGDHGSADIGVLVEDEWQRRGVGSALVGALVRRARERGLTSLRADVLADNAFVVPLLRRVGPVSTAIASGTYTVRIALERERMILPTTCRRPRTGDGTVPRGRLVGPCPSKERAEQGELP